MMQEEKGYLKKSRGTRELREKKKGAAHRPRTTRKMENKHESRTAGGGFWGLGRKKINQAVRA